MAWNEPGNGKDPWKRDGDEPNDLDQIVQEGILKLLMQIQKDLGVSYIFITHDIATVRAIADEVYPHIVKTTDAILAFNDKYEKTDLRRGADGLSDDLSRLGEALADRIQLEDRVIGALSGGRP